MEIPKRNTRSALLAAVFCGAAAAAMGQATAPAASQVGGAGRQAEETGDPLIRFMEDVRKARAGLPAELKNARGLAFFTGHVAAIAAMQSKDAQFFAAVLTEVARRDKVPLPAALEKVHLPPTTQPSLPPLELASREENVQLAAILTDLMEPEKSPFDSDAEARAQMPFLIDLLECVALDAPCFPIRAAAVVHMSESESVLNISIDEGEDLSRTWVDPKRIAYAWDVLFGRVFAASEGKLDPFVRSVLGEFDGEVIALYLIPHGIVDKPGKSELTGALDRLAKQATAAQEQLKDKADKDAIDDFVKTIMAYKKGMAERDEGVADRPAVQALLGDLLAGLNKQDVAAVDKTLSPAAIKVMPATSQELADKLAGCAGAHDLTLFFVAAPELEGKDQGLESFHVVFYLQAQDAKGKTVYQRQEAAVDQENKAWHIREIYLVLDPAPAKGK